MARTFAKARADIFAHLTGLGWKVQLRDTRTFKPLKTPYAVDPSGEHRLNFKPQAVYLGERSIHVDIRDLTPAEFMAHVARWTRLEPNALLQKPPHHIHRSVAAPNHMYEGVHTTSDKAIAAAYAMSVWQKFGGEDFEGYPVILVLDVTGLEPLADIDAKQIGRDVLGMVRREIGDVLREEEDPVEEIRSMGEFHDSIEEWETGDQPAAAIFAGIPRDPYRSLIEGLERYRTTDGVVDDDAVVADLKRYVANGVDTLPDVVLSETVDQQRYLNDFELDRLVAVVAFKPWWDEIMDAYWDSDDEREKEKAESIEAGGWRLWTIEDALQIEPEPSQVMWSQPIAEEGRRFEYHGTVSTAVESAFPGIISAVAPFPLEGDA